jgi:hypothetical protein
VKADRTVLWVAYSDLSLLPSNVIDLKAAGLEIRSTEDIKSYKKILPALDSFPDAFICTADDDLYYWPEWLEELIEGIQTAKNVVVCHRAHEILLNAEGDFRQYDEWSLDVRRRETSNRLFPTGVGGILYPPGILAHSTEDRETAFSLCPDADDIWLYWIGKRNGAIYKTVGRWRDLVMWRSSQKHTLWRHNILRGGNDRQIRNMADRYGFPNCR